ncbi:hypothetical protein [Sphingobium sp.]|uniref:hypothetical protein n=1 Tax=Sphingobium sp. TaxID=1912891 RepID=UPI0035C7555C
MSHSESNITRHMDARMNQRGIPGALVDLVLSHGRWDGDACKLDRKHLSKLKDEVEQLRSTVLKALDKGGVAVVEAGGALVTTYARPKTRRGRK